MVFFGLFQPNMQMILILIKVYILTEFRNFLPTFKQVSKVYLVIFMDLYIEIQVHHKFWL
jgi:hypothetical protein